MTVTVRDKVRTADHTVDSDRHLRLRFNWEQPYYVNALVHFAHGTRRMLESCRVINGAKCDMSFAIQGASGARRGNMERMHQLQRQWRNAVNPAEDGYTTWLSGSAPPYHRHINPAPGLHLGYKDSEKFIL